MTSIRERIARAIDLKVFSPWARARCGHPYWANIKSRQEAALKAADRILSIFKAGMETEEVGREAAAGLFDSNEEALAIPRGSRHIVNADIEAEDVQRALSAAFKAMVGERLPPAPDETLSPISEEGE